MLWAAVKIIRVFPTKTSHTPVDNMAFYGLPPYELPAHDEVHISVVFTWDIPKATELGCQWRAVTDKPVRIGGPALNDQGGEFTPGRYMKKGYTITSRGCNNNCPFCFVPNREGKLRELPITEGNIICDNNFTQCSKQHQQKVFAMLKGQKAVEFKGGLEAGLITPAFVDDLRGLRIKTIWLAYDGEYADKNFVKASALLTPHFNRNKLQSFVLIGYGNDTKEKALARIKRVWRLGFLPFAQLYKSGNLKEDKIRSAEWGTFARDYSRPALTKRLLKGIK